MFDLECMPTIFEFKFQSERKQVQKVQTYVC